MTPGVPRGLQWGRAPRIFHGPALQDPFCPHPKRRAALVPGAVIGPAIGGVLTESFGLRMAFGFCGLIMAGVAALNYFLLPETQSADMRQRAQQQRIASAFRGSLAAWWPMLRDSPNLRGAMLVAATHMFCVAGAQLTLLPLLAATQFGMTAPQIGTIFAVQSVVNIAVTQPGARVSDRWGRKPPIVVGLMFMALSVLLSPVASTALEVSLSARNPPPPPGLRPE